jgi:hypothetical protein
MFLSVSFLKFKLKGKKEKCEEEREREQAVKEVLTEDG